jgi:hypothetical protein
MHEPVGTKTHSVRKKNGREIHSNAGRKNMTKTEMKLRQEKH